MRTKHEESLANSGASLRNSPDLPITTASGLPQARRREIRCLQDLGDLRQLFTSYPGPLVRRSDDPAGKIADSLDEAIGAVVQETIVWAREHESDGRYRDAEYLFRRASSNENMVTESVDPYQSENIMPALVSIYEKLGDYPAAEMVQETLIRRLFAKNPEQVSDEQTQAISTYSRLLSYFQKRIFDLNPDCRIFPPTYGNLFITYRAAVLDIIPLNQVLLERDLIPLEPNEEDCGTSLHVAAKESAINLARLLIEMGADIDSRDLRFRTPLHIAAEFADAAMIEILLAHYADIEALDDHDRTPLHVALTEDPAPEIVRIVTTLINAKANMDATDGLGRTTLNVAVQRDLPAIAQLLLEQGANIEGFGFPRETPLFTAVRYQREWAVRLLLENGANFASSNAQGDTALYVAVSEGHKSIIPILLDHGRKTKTIIYQQDGHQDLVLHCAVRAANVAIVEMLLKSGAIYGRDYNGNTALHQAVLEGREPHERIVQLLLDFDTVQMNSVNFDRDTVLHLAVTHRRRNMIPLLVRHKPDRLPIICRLRNNLGRTPLDTARDLAKDREDSSVERSVLYLLENALELSLSLF